MSGPGSSEPLALEPLVSVVIPAFNAGRYIAETIASVRAQTYPHLEILVVDDGSRDDTAAIVERIALEEPRLRLIRQQNGGVARARNTGLFAATAPLVAPLDADDLWAPTKIEKQVAAFMSDGPELGLVYCWTQRIDAESRIIRGNVLEHAHEGDVFEKLLQTNFIGHGSAPMMRRDYALDVGAYDPRLRDQQAEGCEDYRLYLLLAERYRFAVVRERLVGYRRVEGSMSQNITAMRRSHDLMIAELRERHPELPDHQFRRASSLLNFWLVSRGGAPFTASGWRLIVGTLRGDPGLLLQPWLYLGLARLSARWLEKRLGWLSPRLSRQLVGERPPFLAPGAAPRPTGDQGRVLEKLSSSNR